METRAQKIIVGCVLLILILACVVGYGLFRYMRLDAAHKTLQGELNTTKASLVQTDEHALSLDALLQVTRQELATSEENSAELSQLLDEEKDRNDAFEEQIGDITGTVGKLDKLSKIDPELLIKYSRVYFLNENYKPAKLKEIDSAFLVKPGEPEYIYDKVAQRLDNLLQDAKDDEVNLLVLSGFRSFDEQMGLKSTYTTSYGTGANAFSADQGYSEHQLGTTVDFTTPLIGASLTGFELTPEYAWLQKNAYKYGFVVSYPKENVYYVFEPWHWRFVGEDLAGDLHDDGKFFYDLDQRKIDTYLIKLFD